MIPQTSNKFISLLVDYLIITAGIALYVGAWSTFLIPNNLIGGGVSGMGAIIYYATGIPMGVVVFSLNALLLIGGFIVLGHGFGFKTIYAILLSSVGLTVLPGLIPHDFIQSFVLENGKMLCTIVGGVATGLGIGLTFSRGGSTGGTDILVLIVGKFRNISPGRFIMAIDFVIIGSSLFVPSFDAAGMKIEFAQKVATAFYAFIMVAVNGYALDLYLTGTKQTVQVIIFSKNYETIADAIAFDLNRGVTLLRSRGWYHKKESEVLMVVARKTDLTMLLGYVKELDPNAFITVTSVMGVYGLGFDTIKGKRARKSNISSHSSSTSSQF